MLTIDALKGIGANTEEGLSRCLNNEAFYLRLVQMAAMDGAFDELKEAVEKGDLDTGFEKAHALKGVLGNVSLTNVLTPVQEITEDLRARKEMDYSDVLERIFTEIGKVRALIEE